MAPPDGPARSWVSSASISSSRGPWPRSKLQSTDTDRHERGLMRLLIASRSVVTGLGVVALLAAGVRLASSQAPAIQTVPGMPAVVDPSNLYSETTAAKMNAAIANVPTGVYV